MKNSDDTMAQVLELWEVKKAEGWTLEQLGIAMGYPAATARQSVHQFLKSKRPQLAMVNKFMEAIGAPTQGIGGMLPMTNPVEPTEKKPRELPYNPIDAALNTTEHARRTIIGILESYNGNYDTIAEAVQNSMDALEDAFVQSLPGPYLLEVTVDLKANSITVLDTGIGMNQDQICEAFAPSATFKDPKVAQAMIKRRGDRNSYRGYKGVGLTFLAYGTDEMFIQTIRDGEKIIKGRMVSGRQWAEGRLEDAPLLQKDNAQLGLDRQKRGTVIRFVFSENTRPKSLSHLGASIEIWESILRTRTAAGQVTLLREPLAQIKIRLNLINSKGEKQTKEVTPEFYYPNLVTKSPLFRFLDVWKYHQENPNVVDHSPMVTRQDGVYFRWSTDEIRNQLRDQEAEFRDEINAHQPELYGFRPYHAPLWTEINKNATGQERSHFFSPGLVIAVDRQRLADTTTIRTSRFDFVALNSFVLFHLDKAKPDLGRKTLQSKLMELALSSAEKAVQFLSSQTGLLKPAGEKSTAAQREVELGHEEWVDNVKGHQKIRPLSVPPIAYVSEPLTEQDIVGLFNQLCALGLFPGLKIYATSAAHTYDCYVQFELKGDLACLRYGDIENNPLGLSTDVLEPGETIFRTKGLTLEFKNNLEGFIGDVDNPSKRKTFSHVAILVCWGAIQKHSKSYQLSPINESNLYERRYPGVTHLLRKDGESSHVVQVIMLEHVIQQIKTGHIKIKR